MAKFDCLVVDPPYSFQDRLTMSAVKRGAEANYSTMSNKDIIELDIKSISADNAVLALWIPSSLIKTGLDIMEAWDFRQTQTHIWVKTKKNIKSIQNIDDTLGFGMGRVFRQCHELCLIGVKGKVYDKITNRSQRSVHFGTNIKHSGKPEVLQERLEKMFDKNKTNFLELFARRQRLGWICAGNEAPMTFSEDIRTSITKLSNINIDSLKEKLDNIDLVKFWTELC